jgi:hypothetical protein
MIFNVLPAAFARSGKINAGPPTTRAPAAVNRPNCLRVSPRFRFFDMITSVCDDSVRAARGASACRRGWEARPDSGSPALRLRDIVGVAHFRHRARRGPDRQKRPTGLSRLAIRLSSRHAVGGESCRVSRDVKRKRGRREVRGRPLKEGSGLNSFAPIRRPVHDSRSHISASC